LGEEISIGPYAVVGDRCRLGDGVVIEAHAVLGHGCTVGAGSWLHAGAVLYDGCVLGERVRIHSGTVLGAHGFGYATVAGVHHKIPQVGHTAVGDDVEVGALSSADRALAGATVIGAGTKIDNQVHLGHNVHTGKGCIVCGQVGIAGSTVLGDYVVMAGGAGAGDHRKIGDGAKVAAATVALRDVGAGEVVGGCMPAQEMKSWHRITSLMTRLPELFKRLRRLERRMESARGEVDA
jgi:UDP-3-O-[3-hydroxymyristoyl] glucosamine N-acyltransferase